MELLGYFLTLFVGVSLGLIGGGGSILAVPILVYIFDIAPQLATSYSLFIVGISALIGSVKHYQLKNLNLQTALIFGLPSILSLLFVRKFVLPIIPTTLITINEFVITKNILLMIVFGALMIAASTSMIKKSKVVQLVIEPNTKKLIIIGFLVGIVTGLLGAGGGFLIIPALLFFANLPMKQAIGTSLFIIAINTIIGFVGDIINHVQLNYLFLAILSAIAIVGIFIGTYISKKVDGNKLKPIFGWFVLTAGIYIIIKELLL